MVKHNQESLARRGNELEKIAIGFLAVAWLFIMLRVWTRTFVRPSFGWDDSTMIFAGMVFSAYCGCILYIEANGGGTHVTRLPQLSSLTKFTIASEAAYVATVMVLKISLAIFFARIVVKRWQLKLIHSTVAISCISGTATFFYVLFRCGSDLNAYAIQQLHHKCTSQPLDRFFAFQHAAFAFTTDCVFAFLPIPLLWNTNMTRRAKCSIGLILSLATLGCICSIVRLKYVDGLTQVDDFFWNAANVSLWSTIEPGAGIIAGCMAPLRPLLQCVFSKARSIRSYAEESVSHEHSHSLPTKKPHALHNPDQQHGKTLARAEPRELHEWTYRGGGLDGDDDDASKHEGRGEDRESTECILTGADCGAGVLWAERSTGSVDLERGRGRGSPLSSSAPSSRPADKAPPKEWIPVQPTAGRDRYTAAF